MASLTLKNLPDDLLEALRQAAERDRRSLTQQVIHLLESALATPSIRSEAVAADVEAQVAAWRKLAGSWVSDVDERTEVDELLERRTTGRKVDF
jgi:plasmid stability protein